MSGRVDIHLHADDLNDLFAMSDTEEVEEGEILDLDAVNKKMKDEHQEHGMQVKKIQRETANIRLHINFDYRFIYALQRALVLYLKKRRYDKIMSKYRKFWHNSIQQIFTNGNADVDLVKEVRSFFADNKLEGLYNHVYDMLVKTGCNPYRKFNRRCGMTTHYRPSYTARDDGRHQYRRSHYDRQ